MKLNIKQTYVYISKAPPLDGNFYSIHVKSSLLQPIRHITSSVYNYCGNELLVSYNDDDIYLFDTTEPEGADFIHSYQGHRNEATIKNVNFFGPKSEYVISGSDCGNIFFWDKQSQGIVQFLLADKGVVSRHPF